MTGGAGGRDDLERQRAKIDAEFRCGWVERAARPAVRDGAQPGDPPPAPVRRPFIDRVADDAEVIVVGGGSRQNVALLFSHEHFPGVRFGHRFPPSSEDGARYASIWLKEEIETGALHRMMRDNPPADDAGIIWTTWGASGLM